MRGRGRSRSGEHFGPGTDLVVSLFAVVSILLAFSQASSHLASAQSSEEIGALSLRNASLDEEVLGLEGRLEQEGRSHDRARRDLDRANETIRQLRAVERRALELEARIEGLVELGEEEARVQADLRREIGTRARVEGDLREQLERMVAVEGQLRQELVGLRGELGRVLFLVDRSDSMKEEERWLDATQLIESWLNHLPVESAALILFSSRAEAFPAERTFLPMDDPGRRALIERLEGIQPRGKTATAAALELAEEFRDLDTIILFSDGKPNRPDDALLQARALADAGVVINTVGIGVYFDQEDAVRFLMDVARVGSGSYRAR